MREAGAIWEVAIEVRRFLEPHWGAWHEDWGPPSPQILSQWTCTRSAAFLAFALEAAGFQAAVQSGRSRADPFADEGYGIRIADRWEDHAWVLCRKQVIDITTDQFGAPPVQILPASEQRYRPGDDAETRLALTANGTGAVRCLKAIWLDRC